MVELVLALVVTAAPAADAMGRVGGHLLARAVARVAVPAATCKAERPRSGRSGWIGVPPKTTGYRTW